MSILVRWATRWDRKVLTEMICELARQHGHLTSTETVKQRLRLRAQPPRTHPHCRGAA